MHTVICTAFGKHETLGVKNNDSPASGVVLISPSHEK